MTFRECAIVMAHTGICMLEGDNFNEFYKYLEELFNRPVYTHEIAFTAEEIKERSKNDFIRLCREATTESAVLTWLLDYQIKTSKLKGRYTPYEVLSWVINDWRKEHV